MQEPPGLLMTEGRAEPLAIDVHRTPGNSKYPKAKARRAGKLSPPVPLAKPVFSSQETCRGQESGELGSHPSHVTNQLWGPGQGTDLRQVSALLLRNISPPCSVGLLEGQVRMWMK